MSPHYVLDIDKLSIEIQYSFKFLIFLQILNTIQKNEFYDKTNHLTAATQKLGHPQNSSSNVFRLALSTNCPVNYQLCFSLLYIKDNHL